MQQDAIERLGLQQMLLEPELLETVEPDVHLVGHAARRCATRDARAQTRETARRVVRKVVEELERRLAAAHARRRSAARSTAPRAPAARGSRDIDWDRTIRANLRHYQPEQRTVIAERLIGYGRRQPRAARDVILCVDQSGSMAASVVYSGIFGAVLASLPRARAPALVVFDTAVVDLTDQLADPVDVLFGTQLGGGTDINQALAYCQELVQPPGGHRARADQRPVRGRRRGRDAAPRAPRSSRAGVQVVVPAGAVRRRRARATTTRRRASRPRRPGVRVHARPVPGPAIAAIERRDVSAWAAREGIGVAQP